MANASENVDGLTKDPDVAADLGLGAPAGPGNRFVQNTFDTSVPDNIELGVAVGSKTVTGIYKK